MEAKLMPENKTFLYIVLGLIGLLFLFQVFRTSAWRVAADKEISDYSAMQTLIPRQMGIRRRHAQLVKASAEWERRFLSGNPREANLTLLSKIEEWAGLTGLSYDTVQISSDSDASEHAAVTIRGASDYSRIQAFLRRVERAEFAVSVTTMRLKKDSFSEQIRYELSLRAPRLRSGGGRG